MVIEIKKPIVKLIAYLHGDLMKPEDLVVFGAHATFKKDDPETLYLKAYKEGKLEGLRRRILETTLSSGHLSVLDQAVYTFIVRDVPRLATLYLVQPLYLSHLQQSMRRVEPYGIYIPKEVESSREILYDALDLYYKMVDGGIPKEDARYVIPLYTVTNIQTTGDARELTHLMLMSRSRYTPQVIKEIVMDMINEASKKSPNLFREWGENTNIVRYYPPPNLFRRPGDAIDEFISSLRRLKPTQRTYLYTYSEGYKPSRPDLNKAVRGERAILTLLRNNVFNIITKMSISAFHQAIRQRTWNHIPESIYRAMERFEYIVPPSIKTSKFNEAYRRMVHRLYKEYLRLSREGVDPTVSIGVVSHAHVINDLIMIDGWNLLSSIPLRRCLKAQWEIRYVAGEISSEVAKVDKNISLYTLPKCMTLGECPEKYPCKYINKFLSMKPIAR